MAICSCGADIQTISRNTVLCFIMDLLDLVLQLVLYNTCTDFLLQLIWPMMWGQRHVFSSMVGDSEQQHKGSASLELVKP